MSTIELHRREPRHFVGIRRTVPVAELQGYFAEVLPKVMGWLHARGTPPASMPMAQWVSMDMQTGIADVHAGCFVDEAVQGEGEITPGRTPGGDVLEYTHVGGYDAMGQAWMKVYGRAAELGRTPGPGWEIYVDDPGQVAEDRLRTQISLPLEDAAS